MGACFGKARLQHRGTRPEDRVELLHDIAFVGPTDSTTSLSEGSEEESHLNGDLEGSDTPPSQHRLTTLNSRESPDPSQCVMEGIELICAEFATPSSFILRLFSSVGEPCTSPNLSDAITAELKSLNDGSSTQCSVSESGERGVYEALFTPQSRGRHLLCVALNSIHVQHSPISLYVRYPPTELGYPLRVIPGLALPHAISLTRTSELLVSEWDTNTISVFTRDGCKVREFGSTGRNEGEFIYPWGIATDERGYIYVADSFNNRIQKFDSNGEFVKAIGSLGNSPGHFNIPGAVRISREQKFYICDTNNHRIQILDSDLNYITCFGTMGVGPGQFWAPQSLAFDSKGNVFVVDNKNNNVQVFTPKGEYLHQFGGKGSKPGKLSGPVNIFIDCSDLVYISEWENCRVSVFDTTGSILSTFGKKGTRLGEFSRPSGTVVDEDGFVYVCDHHSRTGRVQIF